MSYYIDMWVVDNPEDAFRLVIHGWRILSYNRNDTMTMVC